MTKELKIEILKARVNKTIAKGNCTAGVIKKWNREIRNLSK